MTEIPAASYVRFHVGTLRKYWQILITEKYKKYGAKMQQLLMTYKSAVEYVDMEAEMFDKFIAPNVTVLKFDGHSFYLSEQIDEAVYFLIEESHQSSSTLPFLAQHSIRHESFSTISTHI